MMLPGPGDYTEPYEEYNGYLWDDMKLEDDDEEEGEDEYGEA